jgi:hypothetical protein
MATVPAVHLNKHFLHFYDPIFFSNRLIPVSHPLKIHAIENHHHLAHPPSEGCTTLCLVHELRVQSDIIHTAHDLITAKLNLQVDIWLGLLVQPVLLSRQLLVGRGQLVADNLLLQFWVACAGRLNTQLDVAAAVHKTQEERCLIDGVTDTDEAVIHEQGNLALGAESLGNLLALLLGGDNAAILIVDSEGAVDIADILSDHVKGLAEGAPGAASDGVRMADGVDIAADLVHLRVNVEAGVVGRTGLGKGKPMSHTKLRISCKREMVLSYHVTADNLASVDVEAKHITGVEEGKVLADGVHPDEVVVFRVLDADVAGDALSEAHASPVAEDCRHVKGDVPAVLIVGAEGGNA